MTALIELNAAGRVFREGVFGRGRPIVALADCSISLAPGETLGVIGESGSGKTTLGRLALRLDTPTNGSVRWMGQDVTHLPESRLRPLRPFLAQVAQDPYASLNPRRRAGELVAQGPMIHGMTRDAAMAKARELFALVGLDPAAMERFPHEFSGGQRQRIGLARALALEPEVLVADEPVSALDVSVQAQVLKLLADLRERLGLSIVFITHDLRVAAQVCDLVAVMKDGVVVEHGPIAQVFEAPRHAYTKALLASVPGRGFGA